MKNLMVYSANVQNAFDNDSAKFEGFGKLLMDTCHGTFDGITKKEANDKIREKLLMSIGCNEQSSKKEIRNAIRRNRVELFEILEESIESALISGWMSNPFFNQYVEVRNLELGDKNSFYAEDDSTLTVAKLASGHHDIFRQKIGAGKSFSIDTDYIGLKVYAEMEQVMLGITVWSDLIKKVAEAIDAYVNQALYDAMSGIADLGAQWMKTGALNTASAADLRTLVSDVQMATGYDAVIMGTKAALSSVTALQNVEWISDSMKDEMYHNGRLGLWEGTELNFRLRIA